MLFKSFKNFIIKNHYAKFLLIYSFITLKTIKKLLKKVSFFLKGLRSLFLDSFFALLGWKFSRVTNLRIFSTPLIWYTQLP